MAKKSARNKGKTEFIIELLGTNPLANATAANEAWQAAGREGSLGATLVDTQRAALGLTGNLRATNKLKADTPPAAKAPYTGKKRGRKPKGLTLDVPMSTPFHTNGTKNRVHSNHVVLRTRGVGEHESLEELEADIDRLLFKVMGLGGLPAIEESLRRTRRLLYSTLAAK